MLDDCVDPTAYVISANIRRRHLSPEDKIKYLAKLVAAQPEKSDRTLAKEAGTTHPTIAKARKQAEATGKTLPVEKRTGADGKRRRQPAKKGRGTVLAARAITSGGAAIAAEPAARETSAGRCLCPSCDGAQHTPDVEGVLCAEPNAELALLREFARFVIGRTRVSTDPKDHAEWKALLGKVKVTLGVTP